MVLWEPNKIPNKNVETLQIPQTCFNVDKIDAFRSLIADPKRKLCYSLYYRLPEKTGHDIEQEWYHQFLGENCPDIKSLVSLRTELNNEKHPVSY